MPQITLKAARVNKGLSLADAAQEIGVSVSTLKNWEAGVTFPKQPNIERMCEIYGFAYDQIFFGSKLA